MAKFMGGSPIVLPIVAVKLVIYMIVTCVYKRENECGHDLSKPIGLRSMIDYRYLWKILRNLVPFMHQEVEMEFYLYKKSFPKCGPQIRIDDDSLQKSGFNKSHQTRIIIHGWMGESTDLLNREITNAYLTVGDFNVIVVDWSSISTNPNYFRVVGLIDSLGEIMANFTKHLHNTLGADYDDMYLIGHSLGAQIAGIAGKRIQPELFNTIFALDPAGPAFRRKEVKYRIHASDAKYVESIQTSVNLGLLQPVGHASFFPNKGVFQNCFGYGCSHSRAHEFFAESITSTRGFWGYRCYMKKGKWHCPLKGFQYKMGGEPSQPKEGKFYVKTSIKSPYALGRTHKYVYG